MKILQTLLIVVITTTSIMAQNTLPQPTIDVTGEGIVRVVPDEVTINIRVENTGENTKTLKEQNDATISEVLKFLKKMNIEDKDVKTQYMNLSKNYDYNSKTYTFAANQSLSVKLRDLKKYEPVMKGLIDTGINRIDGVEFSSSNSEALKSQARKKAVENAQMKAKEYTSVLNQTIGKAVSISEFNNSVGPQPMYKMAMSDSSSGGSDQTIALGEMEIKTSVNVSFLLN
ncbi:SIMPL domain-containing protein [Aequorivita sp. CIP111184]|uniref:SIMPL domain-containing protein n=1 Tax=Aequorivita sp. CIP111184 TaxID=2211356 RepID=UPI000DBC35A6|nr:SIMPL domain-containing protein [Aequorivita sp. CIP111184]SRX54914.1 26 kDa periplasmic immunogenic protein [Aequorivita sp. CIP111184]